VIVVAVMKNKFNYNHKFTKPNQ